MITSRATPATRTTRGMIDWPAPCSGSCSTGRTCPLLAGEVINPPLNAPEVVAEWKPPASFYLAMAPAIALAVVVANLCFGVFWTCATCARAACGPQTDGKALQQRLRRSDIPRRTSSSPSFLLS